MIRKAIVWISAILSTLNIIFCLHLLTRHNRRSPYRQIFVFHPNLDGGGGGEKCLWALVHQLVLTRQKEEKAAANGRIRELRIVVFGQSMTPHVRTVIQGVEKQFNLRFPFNPGFEESRSYVKLTPTMSLRIVRLHTARLLFQQYPLCTQLIQLWSGGLVALEAALRTHGNRRDIIVDTTGLASTITSYSWLTCQFRRRAYGYIHWPFVSPDLRANRGGLRGFYGRLLRQWYLLSSAGYSQPLFVNSTYTKRGLEKLWIRETRILYPPVSGEKKRDPFLKVGELGVARTQPDELSYTPMTPYKSESSACASGVKKSSDEFDDASALSRMRSPPSKRAATEDLGTLSLQRMDEKLDAVELIHAAVKKDAALGKKMTGAGESAQVVTVVADEEGSMEHIHKDSNMSAISGTGYRWLTILSIAQFRAEKNHVMQVQAFAELLAKKHNELDGPVTFLMCGSCRPGDADDLQLVSELLRCARVLLTPLRCKVQCMNYGTSSIPYSKQTQASMQPDMISPITGAKDLYHKFEVHVDVPHSLLSHFYSIATVGFHTMKEEHFGITVVDMLRSGLWVVAHNSGGPKNDILKTATDEEVKLLLTDHAGPWLSKMRSHRRETSPADTTEPPSEKVGGERERGEEVDLQAVEIGSLCDDDVQSYCRGLLKGLTADNCAALQLGRELTYLRFPDEGAFGQKLMHAWRLLPGEERKNL